MLNGKANRAGNIEFWGGMECTINRVGDEYFDQRQLSGHYLREGDMQRIADLGISMLRYPLLWEKHQGSPTTDIDWTATSQQLNELSRLDITPIAGLLHHGSGPAFTDLLDPMFAEKFASYAGSVAKRFPEIRYYTPINEPLTTARFSGLYGFWYPHVTNDVGFVRILLNQIRGIVLAMRAIRKINPEAKLVQTEDLSKTYSSSSLSYQAAFENERRWLTYDLLCGMVKPGHAMWKYFQRLGVKECELEFFIENPLPPDIMGFNYYITSERFLDDNLQHYPLYAHGGNGIQEYADVEAARVNHGNSSGLNVLLKEAWERYRLPMALTEVHINADREDQLRWLQEIYISCSAASKSGIDIGAMTFWSLFGAFGWNRLLTDTQMDYEPGAYDLRSSPPRKTAIGHLIRNMITGSSQSTPLVDGNGWWHRPGRFYNGGKKLRATGVQNSSKRPLLITGKTGSLGHAFEMICQHRNIDLVVTGRDTLDITNENNIDCIIEKYNPWAIINTAGFVKVEEAEERPEDCFEINANAPLLLASACARRDLPCVNFSSDLVFDGTKDGAYLEGDVVAPLNVYGASKVLMEEKVLKENPRSLVIRTSAFFGPWDQYNFATRLLTSLKSNQAFVAAADVTVSPTYLPHLVAATLELLIDQESGLWHLANCGSVTWQQFAQMIAVRSQLPEHLIRSAASREINRRAKIPGNSALGSQRGRLMPKLEHAINCFFNECVTLPTIVLDHQHLRSVF